MKANNLLDTPLRLIIKNTNPINKDVFQDGKSDDRTLIRQDFYQRSFIVGVRFKM